MLITIIGRIVDLDFPAPEYMPIDRHQTNFLLDCDTLERMETLEDRGNNKYSWLNGDKTLVYILPSWISDSFDLDDADIWLPPDHLNPTGVLPDSEDEEQKEEDDD